MGQQVVFNCPMVLPKVPTTLLTPNSFPMGHHGHSFVSKNVITKLLDVVGVPVDFRCYRTGIASANAKRPIIVQFQSAAHQEKALSNVKNLKGNVNYKTISLSPELTKKQRELTKEREISLKAEAVRRNASLSQDQNEGVWVVWGRGEARRLVKKQEQFWSLLSTHLIM
jgi:hypothetical protein